MDIHPKIIPIKTIINIALIKSLSQFLKKRKFLLSRDGWVGYTEGGLGGWTGQVVLCICNCFFLITIASKFFTTNNMISKIVTTNNMISKILTNDYRATTIIAINIAVHKEATSGRGWTVGGGPLQ